MKKGTDIRLIVTMKSHNASDVELRQRVEIAATTLGVTKVELIKACLLGGLENPATFRKHLRRGNE